MAMNKIRTLLILTMLAVVVSADAKLVKGHVLINGKTATAEYTVLSDNTVGLGTGHNACTSQYLTGRLTVPETITVDKKTYSVTEVMPMAFRLCSRLRFVSIPEGVTRIGDFAFVGCHGLRELNLPSTLKSVGTGAFVGLDRLLYVSCAAKTPPQWEYNDVFFFHKKGIGDDGTYQFAKATRLMVHEDCVEDYRKSAFADASLGWTKAEGWGTTFQTIDGGVYERFRIYDAEDIDLLRELTEEDVDVKEVSLEVDIDMYQHQFTPIGASPTHPFKAAVHGQGHTISNIEQTTGDIAGFIGYYAGPSIADLRLRDCHFYGKVIAGSIAATVVGGTKQNPVRIDSILVKADVKADENMGGLVGWSGGYVSVDRCAVIESGFHSWTDNANPVVGAIIGQVDHATVTNCAVRAHAATSSPLAPFVAKGNATIDYAYASNHHENDYTPPTGITYGSHIIFAGQPLSIVDYAGEKKNFKYDTPYFQAVYPAAILGLEAWGYARDRFPMPDCLTDEWGVRVNMATYGSLGMAAANVNTLTPDGDIPASAWLDLSELGFRHYSFKASQLWIDENLNVDYNFDHVPLGFAERITATDGIRLDRTLKAEDKGKRDIIEPVYQMDNSGQLVVGADGQYVVIDHLNFGQEQVWEPKGYGFSLPYNVALPDNCTLYQPTRIYDLNGRTTALMERVRENYVEAFRPYYLVVKTDSVTLGTTNEVVSPRLTSAIVQLDNYEYVAARPFTAYFRHVGMTTAANVVMVFEDSNPVISVGDFYFTINTKGTEQTEGTEGVTATLTGYHGRGGNTVVPPTVPYVSYGMEQQVPVTKIAPAAFTTSTAQVWSIDLSQCTQLEPVNVDRTAQDNPFYQVDERTIIYMPEGKAAAAKNVVVGKECASLVLTDGWDFCPPYGFHAQSASYSRVFYAAQQQDGSYKTMSYSLCLPFNVKIGYPETGDVKVSRAYYLTEDSQLLFSNDLPFLEAGHAYVLRVNSGNVTLSAIDVDVLDGPRTDDFIYSSFSHPTNAGTWTGTFSRISNEEAAAMNAATLDGNSGRWGRIRSDEGRYRNAWVGTFRAYFVPMDDFVKNSYPSVFQQWVQGDGDDNPILAFPTDFFEIYTDFTGYDYIETGISEHPTPNTYHPTPNPWYSIDGLRLNGQPKAKGLYIYNGKIVVIK